MSDERPDDEAVQPPAPEPDPDVAPASTVGSTPVERRAFLRQLTGEAVVTSGRLAGLSSVVRRSIFAAVESATGDVGPSTPEVEPVVDVDARNTEPPSTPPVTPAAPATMTPSQEAFLTQATSAVLGTNDAAGSPHLTASRFHWDGSIVRLPSDLFSARVERIGADPRVSLLVADDAGDAWVSINGTASIVSGEAVEAGMMPLLRKYTTDEQADRSWEELRSSGNPVVIEVRPSRFLWRLT